MVTCFRTRISRIDADMSFKKNRKNPASLENPMRLEVGYYGVLFEVGNLSKI